MFLSLSAFLTETDVSLQPSDQPLLLSAPGFGLLFASGGSSLQSVNILSKLRSEHLVSPTISCSKQTLKKTCSFKIILFKMLV